MVAFPEARFRVGLKGGITAVHTDIRLSPTTNCAALAPRQELELGASAYRPPYARFGCRCFVPSFPPLTFEILKWKIASEATAPGASYLILNWLYWLFRGLGGTVFTGWRDFL